MQGASQVLPNNEDLKPHSRPELIFALWTILRCFRFVRRAIAAAGNMAIARRTRDTVVSALPPISEHISFYLSFTFYSR